ncbi:flagellar biosynthesis anti-sigma factor FlgM [Alicyclobacillus tolerans]|uniref:flagellar biosynthesis anti-sigma factor FlgM n=1 Tax=Alicyclobacillus tolerans TaxID=90970 RepID=UPI001F249E4A|nr:flagellar biosynthesis anti-sigma factor FlgM [Alicyclobacillus tolerans]MCF8567753.1 flagellar biosynthesis anti-sigma factor FlgM [Alicyclobacillus tolerans]
MWSAPNDFPDLSKSSPIKPSRPFSQENSSEKVKRLREAIASGTYQINTQKIAERIVESGALDK